MPLSKVGAWGQVVVMGLLLAAAGFEDGSCRPVL